MQQGQNRKEILVQLGYCVFNLRMMGGRNRIQNQQNRYKEIKLTIDDTPVMNDTMVGVYEDTVAITQNLFAEVFISFIFSSLNVWQRRIVVLLLLSCDQFCGWLHNELFMELLTT